MNKNAFQSIQNESEIPNEGVNDLNEEDDEMIINNNLLESFEDLTPELPLEELKKILFARNIPQKEEGLDELHSNIDNVLKDHETKE